MNSDSISIKSLNATAANFSNELKSALAREALVTKEVTKSVADILLAVRTQGDAAIIRYTNQFDGRDVTRIEELQVSKKQLVSALDSLNESDSAALRHAAERIRRYHEKQKQTSWQYEEADGSIYGQKISPVEKAGVYVPGGKANYPSSMLMLAIPAQVAGVDEIIATVPTEYSQGSEDSHSRNIVFAAAELAGVSQVFTVGGAQAIAAMAFGTNTISKVDKITGPGNVFVTEAKRQVFGEVGIDMLAGPSELTIICDGKTDPDWIAMDLFSQAEHDEQAQSILITTESQFIEEVMTSIDRLLPRMDRKDIIRKSLQERGVFILTKDLAQAAKVSNQIAPEHLELSVADPESLMSSIDHAGAIFLGRNTAEALGDYCAGPSHVLPTSGTARFFSALGVYDFQKRSSIINCSTEGAKNMASTAATLARRESLQAHALSAEYRLKQKG